MLKYIKGDNMPSLLFKNLKNSGLITNRLIAIYYLNNLHPLHERFDLDKEDIIKQLISTKFISAAEIDADIAEYFSKHLKDKLYVQKLARSHFIHQTNSHSFTL